MIDKDELKKIKQLDKKKQAAINNNKVILK